MDAKQVKLLRNPQLANFMKYEGGLPRRSVDAIHGMLKMMKTRQKQKAAQEKRDGGQGGGQTGKAQSQAKDGADIQQQGVNNQNQGTQYNSVVMIKASPVNVIMHFVRIYFSSSLQFFRASPAFLKENW